MKPIFLSLLIAFTFFSCSKDSSDPIENETPIALPTLTTLAVSEIDGETASSGGNVTDDGGATITARGVCWSTSTNPTVADSKTTDGTGTGNFASALTHLSGKTEYHLRAYATNSKGTAYGNEVIFTTDVGLPTLTTLAVSEIGEETASSGGNITNDGGAEITVRGICWSTSPNPVIGSGGRTLDGTGTGTYTSALTYLTANTKYYLRAYAANSFGVAYGNEVTFTSQDFPALTYEGYIDLTSQEEVDAFGSHGYKRITGRLRISAIDDNIINSLEPLKDLTTVDGEVWVGPTHLESFEGLENLTTIGDNVTIMYNDYLTTLKGLDGLQEILGYLDIDTNPSLKNLDGLENLTKVDRWLGVDNNETLENIDGLSGLVSTRYGLYVQKNPVLMNVNGLSSVTSIGENLTIIDNTSLTNLDGLSNLETLGSITIQRNNNLTNINGLSKVNGIIFYGGIRIEYNSSLTDLEGLTNFELIKGNVSIVGNPSLASLNGLRNVLGINGRMLISENSALTSLDGLNNIELVDYNLQITENASLVNIDALGALTTLNGDLRVNGNTSLTDFCGLKPLIDNGFSNSFEIMGNAFNPTQQNISEGNCSP
ncbi:hypothetical protein F8C76_15200 [Flagellimonas olearia]|uniref:Fibronectin type-III domain-containing protein n=1 Tax=Flagellimonas olearia TaxID=552546 RepID=A0A6I1DVU1_9FLAO|nr:hypothetical protein [Allomuricauda olearia]KAB7529178.1 hypothetical protein F8C76_15200 [Allomuricauda olearia]